MAGSQEVRLRHLIAGAQLEATIDKELQQWTDARDRLHDVGAALIAVSTPVSENLGQETVASALAAFKAVGEKVNERADDIQEIHQALRHAVLVTRQAQAAVAEMDGDQRDKPEFGNGEPPTDEADEMHDLKVYVGQMKVYNSWADARETRSQEHADKVETAWQDAIAVMEKIPDDQTSSGGGGGGGGGGSVPGVGKNRRMPVQQAVDVAVPLETAYNQWTQFEDWSDFMFRVNSVSQEDDCTVSFTVKQWNVTRQFTAEIETQRPDERIKWKVKQGVTHTGVVTFHELAENLTRIEINIDVDPSGLIEKAGRGMRHVKRTVRSELHRFKAFIEMNEVETGAWRGVIEEGEVVEDHPEDYDEGREYTDVEDAVTPDDADSEEDGDEEDEDEESEASGSQDDDAEEEETEDEEQPARARSASRGSSSRSRSRGSGNGRSRSGSNGSSNGSSRNKPSRPRKPAGRR